MADIWNSTERQIIALLRRTIGLSRPLKIALLMGMDALLCIIAVWIAFSLRLGVWRLWNPAIATVMLASLAAWLPIFSVRGIYRSVVRYIGSRTMVGIATSCILMAVVLSLLFTFNQVPGVPRTIAVIQPMVFALLLIGSRLFARYILFDLLNRRGFTGTPNKVLIYGAGSAGRQLAVSLNHEPSMYLCGYIDDDIRLAGQHLDGVKVHHNRDVANLIERLDIDSVLLAIPGVSRQQREQIVRRFADISVHVLTLPAIGDLVDGTVSISDLREVEITDLLGARSRATQSFAAAPDNYRQHRHGDWCWRFNRQRIVPTDCRLATEGDHSRRNDRTCPLSHRKRVKREPKRRSD